MLNGIKPLNDEEVINHGATDDNLILQNEHNITNGNSDEYQNPFISDDKVDLNKVQDLSEYQNDDAQTHFTDPFVSVMETSKSNEFDLTSGDNESLNESNVELNRDFTMIKHDEDMNSQNIDDTVNTTNATVGSNLQFDEESFKHSDDFKNDFLDSSQLDKLVQYEDRKLNDSESTTDAILGSEPHTPMRMDNQSTFESENDDDQFSEAFKQQTQFNQFDENNDKENHDPFCFEQTEDPAGIIPNVTHEVNNEVDEISHNIDNNLPNKSLNDHQVSELKHEPVEEPLCIREVAKPFHSVYEQQYLPESDFSASIHEALLNATENESSNHEIDDNNFDNFEPHNIVDRHLETKHEYLEHQQVNENPEPEVVQTNMADDSHIDDVRHNVENFEQEFQHDNTNNFEYENNSVNNVQNEDIEPKHNHVNDEHKLIEDVKHENSTVSFIQSHVEDFEITKNPEYVEHDDVAKIIQENIEVPKDNQFDVSPIQDLENVKQKYNNVADVNSYNTEHPNQENQLIAEDVNNCLVDAHKTEQIPIEDFEQKYLNNVSEVQLNQEDNFKQGLHDEEFENSDVEGFKQEHNNVDLLEKNYAQDIKQHKSVLEVENNHVENFKQEQDTDEIVNKLNEDLLQENHGNESIQNPTTDSDEEMHSSMIIHSDVENNMPQPYCSATDTLINESNMMCTSMTFEENFQNRNMSDSLYVMETSADYFDEEVQQTTQLDQSTDKPTVEEQSNIDNKLVEQDKNINDFVTESNHKIVSEPKIEVKAETTELIPTSQDCVEKVDNQDESNKVCLLFNIIHFKLLIV